MQSKKPESCKVCTLYDADGIVFGEGPKQTDLMFVGMCPGEEEALVLRPFVGGAGRVFNAMLNHAQVSRQSAFVTNLVKCRPTSKVGGRLTNRDPTEHEIRCCAPFLLRELEKVNPNLIVALGNLPLKTLTKYTKGGIMKYRSVPLEGPVRRDDPTKRYKVLSTIHPAGVMRQQHLWPAVVFDLVRANKERTFSDIRRRSWKHIIHASMLDHAETVIRKVKESGRYFHDLETTSLDPTTGAIRCFGISADADTIYCFDPSPQALDMLSDFHKDPNLMTVGQNSEGFDIPFQEAKLMEFNGPTYDTMIGWHLLNSALPKDLGFIGATVTDEVYWKDETMYKAGDDALQIGCCKDVHATARAFEEQMAELKELNQVDLYFKHLMPLQPVLRRMMQRGLRKDPDKAAKWHAALTRKAEEKEHQLKKELGSQTFQVNSPKQLMELLYKQMKLPVQYIKDAQGRARPTVNAGALETLAKQHNHPVLYLIRDIRTLLKWDSTFIRCPTDDKSFIHGHFTCAKAANGRLSCNDPNMQNFPVPVREIVVPDTEDHILLARDWSQIEWRIAMALAGDENGLRGIESGRDIHQDTWSVVWDVPYDEVTKRDRFEAKRYNYGLLYGRGEESLATGGAAGTQGVAIPREKVHDYFVRFWEKYQGFDLLRKQIEKDVHEKRYVETAWGRRRYWYTSQQMPEAYNHPIQGTAASMMYEALVEIEEQLPSHSSLRLTVHDEVVLVVERTQKAVQEAITCTRDVMERRFPQIEEASLYPNVVKKYYPTGWRCPSDCHIGLDWKVTKGDTKEDIAQENELRKSLGIELYS